MQDSELLDYLESLIKAAEHPEIKSTGQYTGAATGVKITFDNGAMGYLALFTPKHGGR